MLAINLKGEFRVSIFRQFLPGPPGTGLDRWNDALLLTVVDMKAFALFSLRFGVGLAMQGERLAGAPRLLVRRRLVLLGCGLVHLFLIWTGDILAEYAVAGLIVLPVLSGPRWPLVVRTMRRSRRSRPARP